MRRAARVDANQAAIVAVLRKLGAFVQPLHTVGGGCPDLLVGYRQRWLVLEVKDGRQPPSKRVLTKDEREWIDAAFRHAPVHIVLGVMDVVELLRSIRP